MTLFSYSIFKRPSAENPMGIKWAFICENTEDRIIEEPKCPVVTSVEILKGENVSSAILL